MFFDCSFQSFCSSPIRRGIDERREHLEELDLAIDGLVGAGFVEGDGGTQAPLFVQGSRERETEQIIQETSKL